jgi:hypothetical protein
MLTIRRLRTSLRIDLTKPENESRASGDAPFDLPSTPTI